MLKRLNTVEAASAVSALSQWKPVNSPGYSVPRGKDRDPDSEPGTGEAPDPMVPVLFGRQASAFRAREEPASTESPSST